MRLLKFLLLVASMATGVGGVQAQGKTWRNYTVADGLPGNHVFMLHQDRDGKMWIGTNNGLALRTRMISEKKKAG